MVEPGQALPSDLFCSRFDEDVFIKSAVDTRLGATADMISDSILSQENLDSLKRCAQNNRVRNRLLFSGKYGKRILMLLSLEDL